MLGSALLFGAGLLLVTLYLILRPFLRQPASPWTVEQVSSPRQRLMAQKAAIYAAIREIDADVRVGKLEPVDHQALRQRYLVEGVAVLKALDELPVDAGVDAAIEADLARLQSGGALPTVDAGRFCSGCGTAADPGDRFCARCGAQLKG